MSICLNFEQISTHLSVWHLLLISLKIFKYDRKCAGSTMEIAKVHCWLPVLYLGFVNVTADYTTKMSERLVKNLGGKQ